MGDYRTPDEQLVAAAHRARVQLVLDQALTDGTSLMVAIELDEPADVVERWIDRFWDGLRDQLTDEDRLVAIEILLYRRICKERDRVLAGVRKTGGIP